MRARAGGVLDDRRNGLNAVRLGLAALVVISHAWPIGGFGADPHIGRTSLGGLAIAGFFGISGYLITGSALRYPPGRFFWHRFLRIFPGYWLSLLVITLVAVPAVYLARDGSLARYPVGAALGFVVQNAGLLQVQLSVGDSLAASPLGIQTWNGVAWTLGFEFLCYTGTAILAVSRALNIRVVVGLLTALTAVYLVIQLWPGALPAAATSFYPGNGLLTASIFLGGSLVHLLRDRIPLATGLGMTAGLALLGLQLVPVSPPALTGLTATVFLLWVATVIPPSDVLTRNDLSYGLYLYALPSAQVLAVTGFSRFGVAAFLAANFALAAPLSLVSWLLVERRALRAKDLRGPTTGSHVARGRTDDHAPDGSPSA